MNPSAAEGSTLLNPNAPEFRPEQYSDQRCLYLTFSNGFPLTESQIFNYFNRFYAPYVENVNVHRPRAGQPPLFGKVVFKDRFTPTLLMGSREKVCLSVDGFPMYCRRFVNRRTQTASNADAGSHQGGGVEGSE